MEKLKSSLLNMLLSLTVTCVVAGGILAAVNMYTSEPITLAKAAALEKAVKDVTPPFDNNPLKDAYKAATSDGDSVLIYPATKDGKPVGVAVESNSKQGFNGQIKIIVGFDNEGTLVNYAVIEHTETPGLGAKMQDWFRTDKNKQSVIGRSLAKGNLTVSKDGGDVDAITASTITSRAFLNAINRAYSAYKGVDAASGASTTAPHESTESTDTKEGGNHE